MYIKHTVFCYTQNIEQVNKVIRMSVDCSYKKYASIVQKQKYLKLHYQKRFLCYKNTLNNYFLANDNFYVNEYSVVFRISKLKEIEMLILDKLNIEFNERYYELEKDKIELITVIKNHQNIDYFQNYNYRRINWIYYLLFILFLVVILWFVYIFICTAICIFICINLCIHSMFVIYFGISSKHNHCENIANRDECDFFRGVSLILDFGMDITINNMNDSIILINIYVKLHYSIIKCLSRIVPYNFVLFQEWINFNKGVMFISKYGVVFEEQVLFSFIQDIGLKNDYFCIITELFKQKVILQIPNRCSKKRNSLRYIMVSGFFDK